MTTSPTGPTGQTYSIPAQGTFNTKTSILSNFKGSSIEGMSPKVDNTTKSTSMREKPNSILAKEGSSTDKTQIQVEFSDNFNVIVLPDTHEHQIAREKKVVPHPNADPELDEITIQNTILNKTTQSDETSKEVDDLSEGSDKDVDQSAHIPSFENFGLIIKDLD